MKIASIVPHRRYEKKAVIIFDDDSKLVVSLETVYKKKLSKDMEISQEDLVKLAVEENYQGAKNKAFRYIERGDKPYKQIYDYLIRKEYTEEVIRMVMDFLVEHGFVDDNRYAKRYIEGRKKREGKSKMRYSLKRKGISEDVIESYLSEVEEEDIIEGIQSIVNKKIRILISQGKKEREIKSKLYSYVASKGFSGENVLKCINEAILLNRELIEESLKEKEVSRPDIFEVGEKRLERIRKSESNPMKIKKKLYDFLMRKGYSYDEIKSLLNELL